ncbi:DNA-binding domain-containing protein, AraC-type, partial [Acidovorax sp. CF316]
GGEPAAAVAAECGFADQAHFTRWFRRSFGYTPGDLLQAAERG